MFSKFPWLNSRKKLFSLIFFDIILVLFISKFNNVSFISILIFIANWIIFNYIIGKYAIDGKKNYKIISKYLIKKFIIFILFLILILIMQNLDYSFSFYLKKTITTLIIIESFIYIVFLNIFNKSNDQHKYWLFVGEEKIYNSFIKFTEKSSYSHKLILYKEGIKINKKDLKGVLVNKNLIEEKELNKFISDKKKEGILVMNLIEWSEKEIYSFPIELTTNNQIFSIANKEIEIRIKVLSENLLSGFLLILTSPLILISAFLIFLEDKGPIFYSQERDGLYGNKFKILKLRTMKIDAEQNGAQWSHKNDKRITKVGKFLRKTRIDELPQLVSVLKGDMSLIGPRPERRVFNQFLEKEIPFYNLRHEVRPGISGWAQVNYYYGSSIEDSKIKLGYDLYYIKHFSNFLDLLILFKTLRLVLNAKGSVKEND